MVWLLTGHETWTRDVNKNGGESGIFVELVIEGLVLSIGEEDNGDLDSLWLEGSDELIRKGRAESSFAGIKEVLGWGSKIYFGLV